MINENSMSSTFRRKSVPYTQVPDSVLEDKTLSLKAKGLYSIILHCANIPNFMLSKKYLLSICIEGETAFNSAWKELKDKGYLKQNKCGYNSFEYEYELLENIGNTGDENNEKMKDDW